VPAALGGHQPKEKEYLEYKNRKSVGKSITSLRDQSINYYAVDDDC
jgi:hypothetical protein